MSRQPRTGRSPLARAVVVRISARPPSMLWRMELSTRFAIRISARLGSPTSSRRRGEICVDLGLLDVVPTLAAAATDPHWQRHLQQLAPMQAGLAIQATTGLRGLPISPWAGLGVLAVWTAVALLAAGLLLPLRDA